MKALVKYILSFLVFVLLVGVPSQAQHFSRIEIQANLEIGNNNGMAVADIDGDFDLDLFVVTRQNPNQSNQEISSKLFRNNSDGTFTDITANSGIQTSYDYSNTIISWDFGLKTGASWGDFNNDGFPDLFLTSRFHLQLYQNNGNGTFTDVSINASIETVNTCYNTGATWWDYDNDGLLDIYITTWGNDCFNTLLKNNGDGTFEDRTSETGLAGTYKFGWMSMPIDINNDGWTDLYVANDYDDPNELFINHGGVDFTEHSSEYNVTNFGKSGMGLATSDYNNDGKFDFFVTNINENSFYENLGTSFAERAIEFGMDKTGWSWGTQFADFDHDLDEDLVVINGFQTETSDYFFINKLREGEAGFEDLHEEVGLSHVSDGNALIVFDYDNDGDQDLLITNSSEGLFFYENDLVENSAPDQNQWVKFSLEGTISNRDGIGSKIEIEFDGDSLRRFYHGAAFQSQSLQPVHFGLGELSTIPTVKITWPSGLVETYSDVPTNATYQIVEGEGLTKLDLKSVKIRGCTDSSSCNYNPEATIDDGSCSYRDPVEIVGTLISGVLDMETYSCSQSENSTYTWVVENGSILSGQGTSEITVRWDIAESGRVSMIEFNECSSLSAHIDITLTDTDFSTHSVARLWNEALLGAIRGDYARPTVHARNLFHVSMAMYDAWAVLNKSASPYLLGNTVGNYHNSFDGFETTMDSESASRMAISFAAYRLLSHRFKDSPNAESTLERFNALMNLLQYDKEFLVTDYSDGSPAALGNFIAESVINYGLIDGSREIAQYNNGYYQPVNPPLAVEFGGNSALVNPNRWQPIQLRVFIDQSGNLVSDATPEFLSPEWGNVHGFALDDADKILNSRDGKSYKVFHDPGTPPQLDTINVTPSSEQYKWNFALVSVWGSHLDPTDGVLLDISPGNLGNLSTDQFPDRFEDFEDFYDLLNGGDPSHGRVMNPITNEAYTSQLVPRGDYARVLAEFWADGPDSETPPGHWFVLLNYVSDRPSLERRLGGSGQILERLEWDIKTYFTLGGAMHDAAISSWSIKGWYDYIRPVSAIRYMAHRGQSSNPELGNYDPGGIPLIPGYIEVIEAGDVLSGSENENVGKIKVYSWKGHPYISDPSSDNAGVGWILADFWWPYQRPSFVTPPFAGYVSGHSTFSRAAAEVLTLLTGSEYFPGGVGEFVAKKNEFLVFEEGPSQDIILQWATYRDASDQCSLSRIWGGIHPPADDIPGRLIGEQVGIKAYSLADKYFRGEILAVEKGVDQMQVYPNPIHSTDHLKISNTHRQQSFKIYNINGYEIREWRSSFIPTQGITLIDFEHLASGIYVLKTEGRSWKIIIY